MKTILIFCLLLLTTCELQNTPELLPNERLGRFVEEQRTGQATVIEKQYVQKVVDIDRSVGRFVILFQSDWDDVFAIADKGLYGKYQKGDVVTFNYTAELITIKNRKTKAVRYVLHRVRDLRYIGGEHYYTFSENHSVKSKSDYEQLFEMEMVLGNQSPIKSKDFGLPGPKDFGIPSFGF